MGLLFVILCLLLCLIKTRADDLPVIKDWQAIQYVGKNVEVTRFRRLRQDQCSPLGTTFINFGRDYPNQRFAGFIADGSKIATARQIATLQGKIIGITGKIELYRGRPEIKVLSISQIKVVDSHRPLLFDLRWKARSRVENLLYTSGPIRIRQPRVGPW